MDDGRLGDEMTLEAIAKRLDTIGADVTSIRSDIKSIDGKVTSLDDKVTSLDDKVASLDGKVASLDGKVTSLDGKVKSLDGKVESLDRKMKIEFEETRKVVKLGFENVEILDEKIGRRFDTTDRANADNKSLLEAALVRLRHDVERSSRARNRR